MQIRCAALKSFVGGVAGALVLMSNIALAAQGGAVAAKPAQVGPPTTPVSLISPIPLDTGIASNSIDAQEVCVRDARIPGIDSEHQSVTTWQVNNGTWNGQNLTGLTLVLVQSNVDNHRSKQVNCYISCEATPAQRAALLDAYLASKPQALSLTDLAMLRMEPAIISLENIGDVVVLHLGLLG